MKIYKLTCNEIDKEPMIISSNYKSPRIMKWEKLFLSKERADKEAEENTEAAFKLLGWMPRVEFIVTELDVIE
jgi:hypothetical protein